MEGEFKLPKGGSFVISPAAASGHHILEYHDKNVRISWPMGRDGLGDFAGFLLAEGGYDLRDKDQLDAKLHEMHAVGWTPEVTFKFEDFGRLPVWRISLTKAVPQTPSDGPVQSAAVTVKAAAETFLVAIAKAVILAKGHALEEEVANA